MESEKKRDLEKLKTEQPNPRSRHLDKKSIGELLHIINEEDKKVAKAVEAAIPTIKNAVDLFIETFKEGGQIYFVGAGTSGRLGVLEAAEMTPTFGTPSHRIQGLIAGGKKALLSPQESREDSRKTGQKLIEKENLEETDLVIGISASGTTPYVVGCLEAAQKHNLKTAGITNNKNNDLQQFCDVTIVVDTGPEVLTGSTRMKAGTAQKMILNMVSTTAMVKLGKVYDNLMVDLVASNSKLRQRAVRMLKMLTEKDTHKIKKTLQKTDFSVKQALVMLKANISQKKAERMLKENQGFVRKALEELGEE